MENNKKFNFKEYYNNNPEFKKKQLKRMKERVLCTCGKSVLKYALNKHKLSKVHLNPPVYTVEDIMKNTLKEVETLNKRIEDLRGKLNKNNVEN